MRRWIGPSVYPAAGAQKDDDDRMTQGRKSRTVTRDRLRAGDARRRGRLRTGASPARRPPPPTSTTSATSRAPTATTPPIRRGGRVRKRSAERSRRRDGSDSRRRRSSSGYSPAGGSSQGGQAAATARSNRADGAGSAQGGGDGKLHRRRGGAQVAARTPTHPTAAARPILLILLAVIAAVCTGLAVWRLRRDRARSGAGSPSRRCRGRRGRAPVGLMPTRSRPRGAPRAAARPCLSDWAWRSPPLCSWSRRSRARGEADLRRRPPGRRPAESRDLDLMPKAGIGGIRLMAHWPTVEKLPGRLRLVGARRDRPRDHHPRDRAVPLPLRDARLGRARPMGARARSTPARSSRPPATRPAPPSPPSPAPRRRATGPAATSGRRPSRSRPQTLSPVTTSAVEPPAKARFPTARSRFCARRPRRPRRRPRAHRPTPPSRRAGATDAAARSRTWQIWNEQNSPKYFAPKVKRAALRPPARGREHRDQGRGPERRDRPRRDVGTGLGASKVRAPGEDLLSSGSTRSTGSRTASTRSPCTRTRTPRGSRSTQIELARKTVKRAGDGGAGTWITEIGWAAGGPRSNPYVKGLDGPGAAALAGALEDQAPARAASTSAACSGTRGATTPEATRSASGAATPACANATARRSRRGGRSLGWRARDAPAGHIRGRAQPARHRRAVRVAASASAAVPKSFFGVVPQAPARRPRTSTAWARRRSARCASSSTGPGVDPTAAPATTTGRRPTRSSATPPATGSAPLPFVYSTPTWVADGLDGHGCGDATCAPFAPEGAAALDAWADFLARRGRSATAPTATSGPRTRPCPSCRSAPGSCWNEQNSPSFYKPKPNVKALREAAARRATTRSSPRTRAPRSSSGGMFGTPLGGRKPGDRGLGLPREALPGQGREEATSTASRRIRTRPSSRSVLGPDRAPARRDEGRRRR